MDVSNPRSRIGGSRTGQLLASRRGALVVAVVAALAAGALFYLFAKQYKDTSTVAPVTESVWVASQDIPKGTAAEVLKSGAYLHQQQISIKAAPAGAVTDLSQVTNAVTATSIRHGDPLTVNDFTASNVSQTAYLSGDQRAITLTLDASHGLTGILQSGNTVDIIRIAPSSGHPVMLAEGITILANTGGNVTLRVTDKQALAIAQAQETDKIWLALRPSVGAISTVPPLIKVS